MPGKKGENRRFPNQDVNISWLKFWGRARFQRRRNIQGWAEQPLLCQFEKERIMASPAGIAIALTIVSIVLCFHAFQSSLYLTSSVDDIVHDTQQVSHAQTELRVKLASLMTQKQQNKEQEEE